MRFWEINTILEESPQYVDPILFKFEDPVFNRKFVQERIGKITEIIEDNSPDYQMVRTGDGINGWIFLHNLENGTADYVIQYRTRAWVTWLPVTVTQCILWRSVASPFVRGATQRMFFDYLLKNYPAIMSDSLQTLNGDDFWGARMADALSKGFSVGIGNVKYKSTDWFHGAPNEFGDWLKSKDTYGTASWFNDIRYIIANKNSVNE